jgi:hypothetical protein
MSIGITAVIIVAVVIVIALIITFTMRARRRQLEQQFGPEYDRAVGEQDSRLRAEAELTGRQRRVRKLDIRPLSGAARNRYLARWQAIQEQFVDAPETAVTDAYELLTEVMRERGYPATDDDEAMADLSVDHARTVGHFRSAQEITRDVAYGGGGTEELRQAFVHYRQLFADLLGESADAADPRMAAGQSASAGTGGASHQTASSDTNPDGDPVGMVANGAHHSPGQQGR